MIWLDKNMEWFAAPTGKRGRAERFTDAAVQFCLMIKTSSIWLCGRRPEWLAAYSSWQA